VIFLKILCCHLEELARTVVRSMTDRRTNKQTNKQVTAPVFMLVYQLAVDSVTGVGPQMQLLIAGLREIRRATLTAVSSSGHAHY
jgi:hypothetical protein